jgi:hypothetical protein
MIPIRNRKKTLQVTVEEMRNFAFAYVEKYAQFLISSTVTCSVSINSANFRGHQGHSGRFFTTAYDPTYVQSLLQQAEYCKRIYTVDDAVAKNLPEWPWCPRKLALLILTLQVTVEEMRNCAYFST